MLSIFKSLFIGKRGSKATAKNRLQMVLVQDRSGLSSEEMENFKTDLIDVLARYFMLERNAVDIEWQRTDNETALIINSPVTGRHPEVQKVAAAG